MYQFLFEQYWWYSSNELHLPSPIDSVLREWREVAVYKEIIEIFLSFSDLFVCYVNQRLKKCCTFLALRIWPMMRFCTTIIDRHIRSFFSFGLLIKTNEWMLLDIVLAVIPASSQTSPLLSNLETPAQQHCCCTRTPAYIDKELE